jgi:hypothetical protein
MDMYYTLGLNGAGIAFFLAYLAHWMIVYPIARRLSGFRWSHEKPAYRSGYSQVNRSCLLRFLCPARALGSTGRDAGGCYAVFIQSECSLSWCPYTRFSYPIRRLLIGLRIVPSGHGTGQLSLRIP